MNVTRMTCVVAATLTIGCLSKQSVDRERRSEKAEPATAADAGGGQSPTGAPVEVRFAGRKLGKPPLVTLLFDVTLRNPGGEPQWFLLPAWIAEPPRPGKGGVTGVEVLSLDGKAFVGRFQGTGGFQALYLPAGGELTLQRFPVKSFEEEKDKKPASFEVVIASQLTVGGQPAEAWYGAAEHKSAKEAEVAAERGELVAAKHTADLSEVPVTVVDERRVSLKVDLGGE